MNTRLSLVKQLQTRHSPCALPLHLHPLAQRALASNELKVTPECVRATGKRPDVKLTLNQKGIGPMRLAARMAQIHRQRDRGGLEGVRVRARRY